MKLLLITVLFSYIVQMTMQRNVVLNSVQGLSINKQEQAAKEHTTLRQLQSNGTNETNFTNGTFWNNVTNIINNSSLCKIGCLDQGLGFCSSLNHTGSGVCCNGTQTYNTSTHTFSDSCPRTPGGVCSFDVYGAWACGGNQATCSSQNNYKIIPNYTIHTQMKKSLILAPTTIPSQLQNGSVCSWVIQHPQNASNNSVLFFNMESFNNVVVNAMISLNYSDYTALMHWGLNNNQTWNASYPNVIYLSVAGGKNITNRAYKFNVWGYDTSNSTNSTTNATTNNSTCPPTSPPSSSNTSDESLLSTTFQVLIPVLVTAVTMTALIITNFCPI